MFLKMFGMRSIIVILAVMTLGLGSPTKTSDQKDIECVDIHKQVAFSHELLQNHKLQKTPSEFPKSFQVKKKSSWKTFETYVSMANCSVGTIPIWKQNESSTNEPIRKANQVTGLSTDQSSHEHAVGITNIPPMYGATARVSVWDPTVEQGDEFSLSQIWITSGSYKKNILNTIEVGWQVSPNMNQDNKPRLFIYWTSDTYNATGCYNLLCPGFIQTSNNIIIGGAIAPLSEYGGKQFEITISVWKDRKSGNWWLSLGSNHSLVGYWPSEIFANLTYAEEVQWGGEVVDSHSFGRQTTTCMGSGHLPDEGFGKASYFRNIEIIDKNNILQPAQNVELKATTPEFYDIKKLSSDDDWGTYLFYGGPGFTRVHSGAFSLAPSLHFLCISFILFFII